MKNKYLSVLIILVALGVFCRLFEHRQTQSISKSPVIDTPITQSLSPDGIGQTTQKQSTQPPTTTTSKSAIPDAEMEYVRKSMADPQYDWKQPINFYGRVVDENNIAVSGAGIHFNWTDISPTGTSHADKISDGNGFFSLTGQHGKRMSVTVSKDGYYTYPSEKLKSFEYANPADGLFTPDAGNPVVFHLRKKGVGADLVKSQNGMMRIAPPTNGAPLFLDFFTQKVGDNGQLKIEGWKEHKDFSTTENNWAFRLTVPDGGLIEENDEFPFEAPDTDYQSVMEWYFKDGDADWKGFLKKTFYIKFGIPPRYGIITVETTAFSPGVYLGYAINPDGSQNLEQK